MKILIATGIYPPQLGGPAKYAYNLKNEWEKQGHSVTVKTYKLEHKLPSIVRHFYYLFKIIPAVISSDFIFALDTFSVGIPATIAAKIFGKKIIMRTGGDFLWEGYVERTGDLVLFKDFYDTTRDKWSKKENTIFKITRWGLTTVSALVFSTQWQKDIFVKAYGLSTKNIYVMENFYGEKIQSVPPQKKNFIAGTRKLKWKNLETLKNSFRDIKDAELDLSQYGFDDYTKKISECYATILVSLGDISPNMILESIRLNKPFILTEENGLMDRIGSIAITINPKSEKDIEEKVKWLLDPVNYATQVQKIKNFNFTHTWEQIAHEILDIYNKL
jgi:glycosyltransferase involved in cell wall biosynthesis